MAPPFWVGYYSFDLYPICKYHTHHIKFRHWWNRVWMFGQRGGCCSNIRPELVKCILSDWLLITSNWISILLSALIKSYSLRNTAQTQISVLECESLASDQLMLWRDSCHVPNLIPRHFWHTSSPWIWKGVSATLQSGRYSRSYPRRQIMSASHWAFDLDR